MIKLNLADDVAELVDNLEAITLRRRGSREELVVKTAFRQQVETQEMQPSGGSVAQADAVWHLQLPKDEDEVAPQIGDLVMDAQGNHWTILQTQQLVMLNRWKCSTRELRIAYGCHQLVDLQRPVWGDNGSGPEIIDWTEIYSALPVNIRLDEMVLDTTTNPPTKQLLYDITLSESVDLEPNDRFVTEGGTNYRLQSLEGAERIDVLPVARAVLEESS